MNYVYMVPPRLFETIKRTVYYHQKIDMDQQHLIFLSHIL